ncbi:MAG: sodium-dependent dicarboxylate transporter 2/3/5 [Myxococcota bacterium]|jgi:sodium-dependent dicarboxylate transporter 2/3/5
MAKQLGLWLGPLGCALLVALAEFGDLGATGPLPGAVKVAGVAFLMAAWWVTEAVPIPATSLLPLVLFPLLGIAPVKAVTGAYADRFILLLMGGFMIALALERWNLHRRIALSVILRVGTQPHRLVLGFMISGAVLSMWISNTATTLMMLPIALAVLQRMEERAPGDPRLKPMGIGLLLGIAYACNVGGLGTPIGTPPNMIYLGQLASVVPENEVPSFLDWSLMALPIVVVMLGVIWWILTKGVNRIDPDLPVGDKEGIQAELKGLGRMTTPEFRVMVVFGLTALLWVLRRKITIGSVSFPGWAGPLGLAGRVDDSTVAVGAAIIMFVIPAGGATARAKERLLDWPTAVKIPWGLLLLFGGGLALAAGFKVTGLSSWIGHQLAGLASLPLWAMIGVAALSVTFLTEITSNTATTTILMPVLAAVCKEQGINPSDLMLPAALSASCAFMLPVATAPNAIVFGSGRVTMGDMLKNGLAINLAGVVVITLWLTIY